MSKALVIINLEEFSDFATFHDVLEDMGAGDGEIPLYFKPTAKEPLLVVSPNEITEDDLEAAEDSFIASKYNIEYWIIER